MDKSTARTCLVMLPTEMKSTPVCGDFANGGGGDSPGSFQLQRLPGAGIHRHRLAHRGQREILEHGDVGARIDRLLQFEQILDLDLHRHFAALTPGRRAPPSRSNPRP